MAEQPSLESDNIIHARLIKPPEKPWLAMAAFVTAWLCPERSARRTLHVRLWSAYAVHLTAALLTFVLITVLASLSNQKHPFHYLGEIAEEFTSDQWQNAWLALAASIVGIELGFLFLALILTPWGAGEERLRTSWSHALRVVWLHTTHIFPCVLLVGVLTLTYAHAERNYYLRHSYPAIAWPSPPASPSDVSANSQANRDYLAAMKEYNRQVADLQQQQQKIGREWRRNRPFHIKYGPVPIAWIGTACAAWILWAMSRAVVVRKPALPTAHPPICEFCGYNLIATPMDSRCPECGRFVVESLGPQVRPGTAWDHAETVGRARAWWRSGTAALLSPGQFGRQMRTRDPAVRHRSFLIPHLSLVFLAVALGLVVFLLYLMPRQPDFSTDMVEVIGMVIAIYGGLAVLIALTIAGLIAGFVGLVFTLRNKRNFLGASTQMVCYLGLYMSLWAAISSTLAVVMFILASGNTLQPFADALRMQTGSFAFHLWALPNVVFLGIYFVLVWRGTSAAQYANH